MGIAEAVAAAFAGDGEDELGASVAGLLADALRPRGRVDGEAMLAELRQAADEISARRQAAYDRNEASRQRALRVYERAQAGAESAGMLAASAWLGPPPRSLPIF
jgi:hypothetical protein